MAPEESTTESSGGATDVKTSPEVDDAKRVLDMASARNLNGRKPEDKDKQSGIGLEGAANGANAVSKDDGVNLLLDGVNSLVRSLPPLVKALDAVAQVHPFIASTFRLRARALSRVAEMMCPNSCRRGIQGCDRAGDQAQGQ